jgi:hypothetical protein
MMNWMLDLGLNRRARRWQVATAVMLFLAGSNYCLAAALTGHDMACLSAPGAAQHPGSHCCPAGKKQTSPSVPTASPCCVSLAQVSGPVVAKVQALIVGVTARQTGAVVSLWLEHDPAVPDESPPLAVEPPDLILGRAPPLL